MSELEKREKSFNDSIKEGVAYSASAGLGNTFISPIAEAVKANTIHIGFLSAITGLVSPLAQHYGNKLMEKHSRKSIVKRYTLLESFSWLLLVLIPILSIYNLVSNLIPWILVILYSFVAISFGLLYPAFFSVLGDLIPEDKRGKYIGRRDRYTILAGTISSIIGSIIFEEMRALGFIFIGFGVLFFLSFIIRMISYYYIKKMYFPESKFRVKKKNEITLIKFLKSSENYKKFAITLALLNFSLMIASPFFPFYLLTELGYSNNLFLFTLIAISPALFSALFSNIMGKMSDKFGNLKLLYISGIMFAISPLVWLFSSNIFWLIFVPGIIAGIANSAYNISVSNFTLDSVPKEKRGEYIGYTNIIAGIGIFLGSLIGGFLIKSLGDFFLEYSPYLIVFVFAAIIRLLVVLIFFPKIKEVRKVKKFPTIMKIHPMKTFNHEIHAAGAFIHDHQPDLHLIKFKNSKKH